MNRFTYAFACLPLFACFGGDRADTGQCPAGETCSPATPNGLLFIGRNPSGEQLIAGPGATAIGGTQDIQLDYADDAEGAFDLTYSALVDAPIGVAVDHT